MKEAREAEIREISGTEEMMPAVSYQTPVADTCGLGMDEEGVIQSGHVPRVPYRAVWFMYCAKVPCQGRQLLTQLSFTDYKP